MYNADWAARSEEGDAKVQLLGRGAVIAPYVAILLGAK